LKSTNTKPMSETAIKSFNSLNIKSNPNYKSNYVPTVSIPTAINPNNNNLNSDSGSKNRQNSNLVHRHSNPNSNFSNNQNNITNSVSNTPKNRSIQQTPNSMAESTAGQLPRIKLNT